MIIYGEPMGKQRPRVVSRGGFTRAYTPEKTVNYETLIRLTWQSNAYKSDYTDCEPIVATITAYYDIPKAFSRAKREQAIKGQLKPLKKPDLDNVAKIILDALNGYAYKDDTQVSVLVVKKFYSATPRVEIELTKDLCCDTM